MQCSVHKIVADVSILAEGRALLVRYLDTSRYDRQAGWFLPDDFLLPVEHPDAAATRIAREQTGVELPHARLASIESFGNGAWHLVFHFVAELERVFEPEPGDNVRDARWFDLAALPAPSEVAHDGWALDVLREITERAADR